MKNNFTKFISRLLLILCFLLTGYQGFAQYTANAIATGDGEYTAMTKDQSNNIYVVRHATGVNYEVVKWTGGNPSLNTVLVTGLNQGSGSFVYPWGLAVNSSGDVFVTNAYQDDGWEIIKWSAATSTQAVIHTGNYYSSLAVDHADNLLSLEYESVSKNYQLVRYPAGNESAAGTPVYNGIAYPTGALSFPWGLSIDSHNDIFFLGFVETNTGSLYKLSYPAYNTLTTLGTGKTYSSLAIDASDNLYTSERTSSTTAQVVKYTYPVAVSATGTTLYTGLSSNAPIYPWGLVVNSGGQIFANDAAAAGNGQVLRLDPITSLITAVNRSGATPTAAGTLNYAVTFNKAVTGVNALSFGLTTSGSITGAAIASVSGSGTIYFVTVNTGTGEGTIRLNVTGTGITSPVSNAPYTTGQVYTIDRTAPAGSIVINSGAVITNNATVSLTLAATDASLMQMRFSNDGNSWSAYESMGATTKSWALSTGDGLKTVYVQYLDLALNVSNYNATITLDQTPPETNITSGPADPANSSAANFAFTSSEPGSTFQYSIDGSGYAACVSPFSLNGLAEGPHTFAVRAIDAAGNTDTSPAPYNWTIDQTAPVVTSVTAPAAGYYVIGSSIRFKVNFSENVQVGTGGGLPYLDVTLASGAVKAYITALANNVVTFTYVVVDGDAEPVGPVLGATLKTNGGYIRDLAGNDANPALQSIGSTNGVIVNTVRPTVVLTTSYGAIVNHPLTATVTFSEAVYTLTKFNFVTTNATINSLTTSDNITFNVTFTPIADGPVQISIPASVVQNIAGNPNNASNTLNFTYDGTIPVITAVNVPANGYYKAGDVLGFTVNCSETLVKDFTGGNPYLNITVGSTTLAATLTGSTSTSLTFSYTVVAGDQDMDGIAVNSLVLNGGTITDPAGNNLALTLNSVGNTANVKVNTTHPAVSIASAAPDVNSAFTATVTFSEAVSGFTEGDVVAANATISNRQTSDNITFTVLVTPTAQGNVSLNIPANSALNIGANGNSASATLNVNYDITAPFVTSVDVPANGYYKAGDNLDYKVNYNEALILNTTGGSPYLNITIGSTVVHAVYVSATSTVLTFRYTVTDGDQDLDGVAVNSLTLNGATIKDAAGNNATLTLNAIANSTNVRVNTTHATVIVTAPAAVVNAPYTASITFSEAVTGFALTGITATNASLSNLQTTDNITFTVLVTPVASGDVSLAVAANVAANIGNNGNAVSNTLHVTYDIDPPVVTSVDVPISGYHRAGTTLDFGVNYSEAVNVTGSPYIDVTLATGTVKANYVSGSGTGSLLFEYTIVDGDQDMDGIAFGNAVQLNGGAIQDNAGNNSVTTLVNKGITSGVLVNTTYPTVTLSTPDPHTLNHGITFYVTFSEVVTGFTLGDIHVTNGMITGLSTSNNLTFYATAMPVTDGAVTISIPAAVAKNTPGNDNKASTNTLDFVYDVTGPVVTSVTVPADKYYQENDVLTFKVNFNEPIYIDTTTARPYLNVTIGSTVVSADSYYASGNSLWFYYTVVNGDMDMDGITIGNIVLNGNYIQDTAKNNAILTLNNAGSTANVFVNTAHPSVTITRAGSYLVNAPFTATVTFSEAVTGFTASDLTTTNATISNLQTTDNITYTVLVTPAAEGNVLVGVPASVAVNIANNVNTAAPAAINAAYDVTHPLVSAVTVPANGYYQEGTVLDFHLKFDSDIFADTTGGAPYLNITIGSSVVRAHLVDTIGGQAIIHFSYTVQNGDLDMDGITVSDLVLNGGTINDLAGNTAILTLHGVANTSNIFVNTVHASVVLTSPVASNVKAPFTATITFSEAMTGFAVTDITGTNATISNLQTTDNITFTVLVTPLADGDVAVSVPANVAVNIANNGNDVSNTLHRMYDATAPTVTSVNVPANGYYTDGNTLNFTVHFSEPVLIDSAVAKPYLNIVIGSTTVKALYTSKPAADAISFSYNVLPGQMDLDGIAVGTLTGALTDSTTNSALLTLNNVASTTAVIVNTARPAVVVSSTAATRVNAPFAITVVFSEAVTGFSNAGLAVTNGIATNLQTTDNITYTADIMPPADGLVSVYVPANSVHNNATNPNSASDTVKRTYDITAPVITAGQTYEVSERAVINKAVGTVIASDASGILQDWTIKGDDTGGAFSIDNNGLIHVADTAILRSKVNTVANVTITLTDGLNTSAPISVAITIRFVNQAPKLDTISSTVMCTNTDAHTIQLTGASAVETDQTYGYSISADKPNFEILSVSAAGVITYQLKAGVSGITTVTVAIKDDGGVENGGVDTLRRTFTITANSLPVISISSDKGSTISKGDIVHLTATGGTSYSWNNAAGNISGEQTGILETRPMENTTYHVTVSSTEGCRDSATISVNVVEDFKVDAINILTPNGDGKDDKWVIRNIDSYPNNEVKVYDRAGRVVYTRRNYDNSWDATMNGAPLAEGTYYYILTIEGGKTAKGYITIIRDRN